MAFVVQDPSTKRHQPRDYLDRLEQRVNLLEEQLREAKSGQVPVPGRESDASWDADFDQSEGDDLASIVGWINRFPLTGSHWLTMDRKLLASQALR